MEYRRDWHIDLDSLLLPPAQNHYSAHNRGAFRTLPDDSGALIAVAAVRHLAWKPNILAMFPGRYARGEDVASLWRVYVRRDRRGLGLGRWLTAHAELEAASLGYPLMYLHASSDAPATLAFWRTIGYRLVGTCPTSTHFDKPLKQPPLG